MQKIGKKLVREINALLADGLECFTLPGYRRLYDNSLKQVPVLRIRHKGEGCFGSIAQAYISHNRFYAQPTGVNAKLFNPQKNPATHWSHYVGKEGGGIEELARLLNLCGVELKQGVGDV